MVVYFVRKSRDKFLELLPAEHGQPSTEAGAGVLSSQLRWLVRPVL